MADEGVTITIDGLDDVCAMFDKLSTKSAEKIMRKALRAGATFEQKVQASAAPIRPDLPSGTALPVGALANDVGIRVQRVNADSFEAIVGPNKATRHVVQWLEFGHRMVRKDKEGNSVKVGVAFKGKDGKRKIGPNNDFVPAHPYIRNAWEASVERVVDIVSSTVKEEVTKAAAKGGDTT